MKKIAFVCPYFGTLPKEHTPLFLQSCAYNKDIDWLLFTDDRTEYDYPDNVKVYYSELQSIVDLAQSKFDFQVGLSSARPYKFCDFKPAYGYIFSDMLCKYDYWGYCDNADSIYGDLGKFLLPKLDGHIDKVGILGHMTLYRNDVDVNKRFMKKVGDIDYRKILSDAEHNYSFDELFNYYSVNSIWLDGKYSFIRCDRDTTDVLAHVPNLRRIMYNDDYDQRLGPQGFLIFEWNKGKLYEIRYCHGIQRREIGYAHFPKRVMKKTFVGLRDNYLVVPNEYVECEHEVCKGDFDRFYGSKTYFYAFDLPTLKYELKFMRKSISKALGVHDFLLRLKRKV